MADPFREYFERDFLAVGDFVRQYGIDRDISLRISQFGVRETRVVGGKSGDPQTVPKPVVYFVEHPGKPFFLGRGNFECLLDRFGDGYWLNDRRGDILYAPVKIRAVESRNGRDGVQYVANMIRGPYHDHRQPLGEEVAAKITAAVDPLGFTLAKFRSFLQHEHRDLVRIFDSCESIADMPRLMAPVLSEWQREAKSDITRPTPPTPAQTDQGPRDDPRPPDARPRRPGRQQASTGGHSTGFMPDDDPQIGHDDIPF